MKWNEQNRKKKKESLVKIDPLKSSIFYSRGIIRRAQLYTFRRIDKWKRWYMYVYKGTSEMLIVDIFVNILTFSIKKFKNHIFMSGRTAPKIRKILSVFSFMFVCSLFC